MGQIRWERAVITLQTHALGVGENHLFPEARDFTRVLIRQGHVKALFLEYPWSAQDYLNGALSRPSDSGDYELMVCGVFSRLLMENRTHLGCVAACAGRCGVPVYLIDKHRTGASRGELYLRDVMMAKKFKLIAKALGSEAHCLLLCGGSHFHGSAYYGYGGLGRLLGIDYVLFDVGAAFVPDP